MIKRKNNPVYRRCCAILLVLCSTAVYAESSTPTTLGSIGLSQRNMELSIRDRHFNAQFTTLELALAKSFKPFFISLNHERSLNNDVRNNNGNGLLFFERHDSSLTFGARLNAHLSLFGGIRQGVTDSQFFNGASANGTAKSQGAYAGVSANYNVGRSGMLAASVAMARLAGEVTLNEPFVTRTVTSAPALIDGRALGFSYSLRWTGALTAETSYNVQWRLQRYTFDDQVVFGGIDLSYRENFRSLMMGITHNF